MAQALIAAARAIASGVLAVRTGHGGIREPPEGECDEGHRIGAKAFQREHDPALAYNTRDLLAKSERAIERMDAGTYGVCESCGQAIGKARLQAFPRATLCVTCKQREERR